MKTILGMFASEVVTWIKLLDLDGSVVIVAFSLPV